MNKKAIIYKKDDKKKILIGNVFLLTALFLVGGVCILFWEGFMRGSDFSWTVQQPDYWNAVVEMLLVFWVYVICLTLPVNKAIYRYIGIILSFLVLMYMHAFIFAILVSVLYALMIYLTGHLICKSIYRYDKDIANEFHFCFTIGVAGIICLVAIASLLKCGTPSKLRLIFPIVFISELILERKQIKQKITKIGEGFEHRFNAKGDFIVAAILALICTMVTVQACRANLGIDYDSIWYGLRSNYVLAPENGIYDKLIMMACVYTYSKGFEVLSLVFSGLPSYSFTISVNVMMGVLTLLAIYRLGQIAGRKRTSLFFVLLVSLTPSIMNMMVTAKSDTVTIYLQVVVLLYAALALKEKRGQYLLLSFSVLLLSFGFKPSSIVFSTMIAVILLIMIGIVRIRPSRKDFCLFIMPLASICFLWGRTVLITGYPITSLVVPLFEKMGYYPKYPYTLPPNATMSLKTLLTTEAFWERLLRLPKIFFYPNTSDVYTLEMTWWGPLFSVIWIVSLFSILLKPIKAIMRIKEDCIYGFQVICFLVCSGVSLGCMMLLSTPDGNYFVLMHILTYWYASTELCRFCFKGKKLAGIIAVPLVACNFLLCIAISWAWSVGLTPIEMDNYGYYNHEVKQVNPQMQANELTEVYEYLKSSEIQRMIVCSEKEAAMFKLPAVVESYTHQKVWAPETIKTVEELYGFLKYADVDSILFDEAYSSVDSHCTELVKALIDQGKLEMEFSAYGYAIFHVVDNNEPDGAAVQYMNNVLASLENNS